MGAMVEGVGGHGGALSNMRPQTASLLSKTKYYDDHCYFHYYHYHYHFHYHY